MCLTVGKEQCRPAAQLEMGTVIKKVDGDIIGDVVGFEKGNVIVNRISKSDKIRLATPTWNTHFQQECARPLGGYVVGDVVSNVIGDVELAA